MIQVTAYLQTEEDYALWKALPNKAKWLHTKLNEAQAQKEAPKTGEHKTFFKEKK